MAKFLSGREPYFRVGIESSTEDLTSFSVVGNSYFTGIITASNFVGDGSQLTGIIASGVGIEILDNNVVIGAATTLNFGDGIDVTPASSGIVTIFTSYSPVAGFATYAASAGIVSYSSIAGVASYAEVAGIATYAAVSAISSITQYAPIAGLASETSYSYTSGIATYAQTAGVATYSSVSGIASYSPLAGIASYADVSGIATFASVAGVVSYSNFSGIATFAVSAGLATVSISADTATYAVTSGVATYASIAGVATYASSSGVATYSSYSESSGVSTYASAAGIATDLTPTSNVNTTGVITASKFVGDGSGLTGIIASGGGSINILDDDFPIGSATTLNFGEGLTATTAVSGIVTVYTTYAPSAGFATQASQAYYSTVSGIATLAGIATYAQNAGIATLATLASYATTAGVSTNIKGGVAGNVPYQSATDTTTFVTNGITGQVLLFSGSVPYWGNVSAANGAFGGISVRDEGTPIGTANSIATLDFRGENVSVTATTGANGIATITVGNSVAYATTSGIATYASSAGIATIAGIATYAESAGIATVAVGFGTTSSINTTGIITATRFVGDGSFLTGILATGTAIFVTDNDASVGSASTLNFGQGIDATLSSAGIVTVNVNYSPVAGFSTISGIATSVIGGIGSITRLTVSGVSTFSSNVDIGGTLGIGTIIDIIPYDTLSSGTLSFEGSAGQLFSITNNLTTGSIFSVNDVSGIPSIDVNADGTIQLAPYATNENVGLGTTRPTSKLHVIGNALISGVVTAGIVTATTFFGDGSKLSGINAGIASYAQVAGIATISGIATYAQSAGIATVAVGLGTTSSVNTTGVITAFKFVGDGSGLTGIVVSGGSVVNISDNDTLVGSASTINFAQGIDVTPSVSGIVTVYPVYSPTAGIATVAIGLGNSSNVYTTGIITASSFVGTGLTPYSVFGLTDVIDDPYFSNVSLLLKMDGSNNSTTFIDNSSNNLAITANGDARISIAQSKFGGTSGFFDGTGDYLTLSNTTLTDLPADFTIELWFNANSFSTALTLVGKWGSSQRAWLFGINNSTTIQFATGNSGSISGIHTRTTPVTMSPNTWYHIAVSRSLGTIRIFLNGIQCGADISDSGNNTSTQTTGIAVNPDGFSFPFSGYIDDLRITKGISRYNSNFTPPTSSFTGNSTIDNLYSNVSLLMKMDGANGSTTFVDSTSNNLSITPFGNVAISTAQSRFGGSSAIFDGSGDYLQFADSESFNFGSGDFTIEMWIYPNALPGASFYHSLLSQRNGYTAEFSFSFHLAPGGVPNFEISNTGNASSGSYALLTGTSVSTGTWTHVAVTRQSGTLRMFQNGSLTGTNSSANFTIYNSSATVKSGAFDNPPWSNSYYNGYIDELRVTKGIARYTSAFTAPTSPLPSTGSYYAQRRLQLIDLDTTRNYLNGNLGIGTTNPQVKLDVIGDARVTGVVTASAFVGDGSRVTNTRIGIQSAGSLVATASTVNFLQTNIGITTSNSGIVTIGITSHVYTDYVQPTISSGPKDGNVWLQITNEVVSIGSTTNTILGTSDTTGTWQLNIGGPAGATLGTNTATLITTTGQANSVVHSRRILSDQYFNMSITFRSTISGGADAIGFALWDYDATTQSNVGSAAAGAGINYTSNMFGVYLNFFSSYIRIQGVNGSADTSYSGSNITGTHIWNIILTGANYTSMTVQVYRDGSLVASRTGVQLPASSRFVFGGASGGIGATATIDQVSIVYGTVSAFQNRLYAYHAPTNAWREYYPTAHNAIRASYATTAGVSTSSGISTYSFTSGLSTSVIGGIASVTQLNVTGVTTLGFVTSTNIFNNGSIYNTGNIFSVGVITALRLFGEGSGITGIVGVATQWISTPLGIHTTNNVGIGTTRPLYNLHVNGDVVVSGGTSTTQHIKIRGYEQDGGALSFEGSSGQLLSISNNLTGTLFAVNNISGLPIVDVNSSGTVSLGISTGNVGVGTTRPTSKLSVTGDGLFTGVVTATRFFGDGSQLSGITASYTQIAGIATIAVGLGTTSNINTTGIISASAFYGNGQYLTNIPRFTSGSTPPSNPTLGDDWFNLNNGGLYKYVQDVDNSFWFDTTPQPYSLAVAESSNTVGTGITFINFQGSVSVIASSGVGIATVIVTGGGGGGGITTASSTIPRGIARNTVSFAATTGQTTFATNYDSGQIDVFLNGVRLSENEYAASDGQTIVLSEFTNENDLLEVVSNQILFVPFGDYGDLSSIEYDAFGVPISPVFDASVEPQSSLIVNDFGLLP